VWCIEHAAKEAVRTSRPRRRQATSSSHRPGLTARISTSLRPLQRRLLDCLHRHARPLCWRIISIVFHQSSQSQMFPNWGQELTMLGWSEWPRGRMRPNWTRPRLYHDVEGGQDFEAEVGNRRGRSRGQMITRPKPRQRLRSQALTSRLVAFQRMIKEMELYTRTVWSSTLRSSERLERQNLTTKPELNVSSRVDPRNRRWCWADALTVARHGQRRHLPNAAETLS